MTEQYECDVAIVGMGPVGVALAGFLGLRGLRVVAMDKEADLYAYPRAAQIDHEILRLLDFFGIADDILATTGTIEEYRFQTASGEILFSTHAPAKIAPTGFPPHNMIHQPTIERILRDRVFAMDKVTALVSTEFTEFTDHGDKIDIVAKQKDADVHVNARFLVGCDGAGSRVRNQLGIKNDDMGFDEPWLVVDVLLPEGVGQLSPNALQICDPARPTTYVPICPGRHRWEFMLRPDELNKDMTTDAMLKELISPWTDPETVTLERRAVYHFHATIAQQWRKGSVILCGDAAHQMPPFLGQGLCSGMRDAAALAWRLEAVLRNRACDALLDDYQPEREPHVRIITELAIGYGQIVCTMDEAEAAARDADFLSKPEDERASVEPPLPFISHGIIKDSPHCGEILPNPGTVGGEAFDQAIGYTPVLIGPAISPEDRASAAECGVSIAVPDVATDAIIELLQSEDAVLAKPDRVVFGIGKPNHLLAAWRAYLAEGTTAS